MTIQSYWHSILSWLASYSATTGTNVGSNGGPTHTKNTLRDQPTSSTNKNYATATAKAAVMSFSKTVPRTPALEEEVSEYEYEMYDVREEVVASPTAPLNSDSNSNSNLRLRRGPSGHGRSKSESCYTSSSRGAARQCLNERPYNTLPRSRGHTRTHARTSSYAPVIVVPGVVNSSFMLFSPVPKVRGSTPVPAHARQRRMQTFSESGSSGSRSVSQSDEDGLEKKKKLRYPTENENENENGNSDLGRTRYRHVRHHELHERDLVREQRRQGKGELDGESSVSEEENLSGSETSESASSVSHSHSRSSFDSSDSQSSYNSYTTQTSTSSNPDVDAVDGGCRTSSRGLRAF